MKIGVLAVQGAFIEHEKMIEALGHEAFEIRQKRDLNAGTWYLRRVNFACK